VNIPVTDQKLEHQHQKSSKVGKRAIT